MTDHHQLYLSFIGLLIGLLIVTGFCWLKFEFGPVDYYSDLHEERLNSTLSNVTAAPNTTTAHKTEFFFFVLFILSPALIFPCLFSALYSIAKLLCKLVRPTSAAGSQTTSSVHDTSATNSPKRDLLTAINFPEKSIYKVQFVHSQHSAQPGVKLSVIGYNLPTIQETNRRVPDKSVDFQETICSLSDVCLSTEGHLTDRPNQISYTEIPIDNNSSNNPPENDNWTCAICLSSDEETTVKCEQLPCSHLFHNTCLFEEIEFRLKQQPLVLACPICRERYSISLVDKNKATIV